MEKADESFRRIVVTVNGQSSSHFDWIVATVTAQSSSASSPSAGRSPRRLVLSVGPGNSKSLQHRNGRMMLTVPSYSNISTLSTAPSCKLFVEDLFPGCCSFKVLGFRGLGVSTRTLAQCRHGFTRSGLGFTGLGFRV